MVLGLATAIALAIIVGGLLYSVLRRAYFSLQVGLACVMVFVMEVLGVLVDGLGTPVLLQLGFTHGPNLGGIQPFQPWEPVGWFTAIYVHSSVYHLFFNAIALVFFGLMLEDRIGSFRYAVAFYATAAIGALGFFILHFNEPFVLVGASGAVSGVFGVLARLYPRERVSFFLLPIPLPMYLLFAGNLLIQFLLAFLEPQGGVAFEAHIVAACAGFALAPIIVHGRAPALGPARPTPRVAVEDLRPLATTPELREVLATVEHETVPEVRAAWISRFQERARCPRCGGALRWSRANAVSPCGWRLRP